MIIDSFKYGICQLWQYKKMWGILYISLFVLSVFVAYPLKSYLEKTIGSSLMVEDIMKGFNYTLYTDFTNHYGDGVSVIFQHSVIIVALFMGLFIFFMGGIIGTFFHAPEKYNSQTFWGNSAHHFWRMLRMTIYFLIIHGLVLMVFYFTYLTMCNGFDLENEGIIFSGIKILSPIYIIVLTFFFMWQDYAKIILIQKDKRWVFNSMIYSLKFVISKFKFTWGLYTLNMFILGLVFILYYFIINSFEITSFLTILISFILSQTFVITRLGMKLINLSSANNLYSQFNPNE